MILHAHDECINRKVMRMWVFDQYYCFRVTSFLLAWMLMQMPLPHAIASCRPQWVLITLLWWLWCKPSRISLLWIVAIGIMTDYLSGLPMGIHVTSFVALAGCVTWLHRKLMHFNIVQQILFSIVLLSLNTVVLRFGFFITHMTWLWAALLATQVTTLCVWVGLLFAFNFHQYWFAHVD